MAGTSCAPEGALAIGGTAEGEITARVNRLLEPPPPLPRTAQACIVLSAALLVASVLVLLVIPLPAAYQGPYGPWLVPLPERIPFTFGFTSTW
jgi:hypothetical protein